LPLALLTNDLAELGARIRVPLAVVEGAQGRRADSVGVF